MADIHRRIVATGYFQGTGPDAFAAGAGPILGDVNHVHPCRVAIHSAIEIVTS